MDKIIDTNLEIVSNIREIYETAPADKIRHLISKHFIPTNEEKKEHAEIPTPVALCDDMLDKVPPEFWTKLRKVFEPCCGKGNFVLSIFDRFFKGLADLIPDEIDRCRAIVNECLYYADLTPLNVFITTELLKCHVQSYCGVAEFDASWTFHSYTGDTLMLDVRETWGVEGFDAVICNPPYQSVSENGISKGGGNNLYTKFIYYADKVLFNNGYMLFINPPTYFSAGRSNNKNDMNLRKDVLNRYYYHYINLEECSKHFNVGSKFIYYLIQKNNNKNEKLEILCKYNSQLFTTLIHQDLLTNKDYLPYLLTNKSLIILNKIKTKIIDKLKIFNSPDNRSDKKHILKRTKKESDIDYKNRAFENKFIYPMQATSVQIVYSSKKCKNQNDKKVLMSESGYLKPFYDDGILGVGGHCFCCLVNSKEEGEYIINLLNSKLYKFYIDVNKWSGFHNKVVLQDLSYIQINTDFNNNDIYEYFNITKEEVELIESVL